MRFLSVLLAALVFSPIQTLAQDLLRTNITFESGRNTLHGELLLPQRADSVPMIIFLVGAGENSSHRTLYKNFVEQNLEALFIKEGYGILYFDKRGVGNSEGRWQRSDIYDRADDAKAAIDYLKTLNSVDPDRIGVIGHSQGGWVAQVVGSLYRNEVKAIASIAGPVSDAELHLINIYNSDYLCQGETEEKAFELASKKALSDINWVSVFPLKKAWRHLKEIAEFDPSYDLKRIIDPALFIFPSNDRMVYPGWALTSLNETFPEGIPDNFTLSVIPGANHDLKNVGLCSSNEEAESALYSEYFQNIFKSWILNNL
ncbi:MAG: alpha/beta hydrolase [Balneola sp.]